MPEQVKNLLDKYELVISDEELVPSSYEIYTREDFDGYIAFTVGENGLCHPLINDETFWSNTHCNWAIFLFESEFSFFKF